MRYAKGTQTAETANQAFAASKAREARAAAQRPAGGQETARAAMEAARAAHGATGPATKLAGIQALMAAGDMRGAILAAARLPELGPQRDAILRAKDAIRNPDFQRQLKRDPEALIAAGAAALRARFA